MSNLTSRYFNPLRLTTYVLVLYFVGHTWGALLTAPQFGPAADSLATAMKSVTFACESAECTWFGFYLGFGWFVSVFFALSAGVTWFLGGRDGREQHALAPIVWMLFLAHAAGAVIAWKYFFVTPGVFSTVTAALLGFQCLRSVGANTPDSVVSAR